MTKLNYDALASWEAIWHLPSSQVVIIVNSASPYRTLADLIGAARAESGDVTVAGTGVDGIIRIAFEMFKRAAKVNMTYVPYPGAPPQVNALLGQHVTSSCSSFPNLSDPLTAATSR